ncbi:MAG: helix-turn-helix transcriptional regulator [Candidatus Acetothermia bacterium]|jgi:poly-beta-hydroxybutyrate-responsive repressor|nr:helix-turn-helix transcriptional regulator [Candidatus Acetothermia bacterium]
MCSGQDRGHEDRECCPQFAGRVRGFLQPWILLELSRGSAHGYELLERLSGGEDVANADPGFLYRTLRGFEEEGLVRSSWDTAGSGPARRVYAITDLGREHLHAWALHLRHTRDRLNRFLADYEALTTGEGGERDVRA